LDDKPRHLEQRKLRDVPCYRVALDNPAGTRILWIDANNFKLLRMELPMESQRSVFDPYGEFSRYAVLIDYIDPQIDVPVDAETFAMSIPDKAVRVRRFVLPPMDEPPSELGKPVAPFSFTTLVGEQITSESLSGKVALMEFWSQNCPPCREHTPLLEEVYQELKGNEDFVFYAVNLDQASLSDVAASRIFRDWGGSIPVLRDPEDDGYRKLGIRAYPHTILLDRDGRVQFNYSGMHTRAEPLVEKVRQLLAGKDLAAEAAVQYARLVKRFEEDLKAAELTESLLDPQVVLPKIPLRTLPGKFEFRQLWQSSPEELQQPGDVQVSSSKQAEPRLLVLEAGHTIAELDSGGNVFARHELPQHREKTDGFLRLARDAEGRRWCAASGVGWQHVIVLNEQWQNVLTFPEEEHAGIGDVLLADLAGGNAPLLYVGYWGGGGFQGGTLDGRMAWNNRRLDRVLQISPGPVDEKAKREVWCTSNRGTLTQFAADGQFVGEIAATGQTLTHIGPVPTEDSGLTGGYCGLTKSGAGEHAAIGFDAQGEIAWRYELPRGDYLHEVPRIHIVHLPGYKACWLVVAADGSLHWLTYEGELIDRFDYGAPLTGLAVGLQDETPQLWIATAQEVTAWQIHEKQVPEPTTDTPTEE
jgi:cytochrome c biogenesis protein CcmG/thiol:disulfide interchange protein DsbE